MMANIRTQVSSQEAQRAKNEINRHFNELEKMINNLNTQVRQTSDWWEGATTTRFQESFNRARTIFINYLRKLNVHAENIVKTVERQRQQDSQLANQIGRH